MKHTLIFIVLLLLLCGTVEAEERIQWKPIPIDPMRPIQTITRDGGPVPAPSYWQIRFIPWSEANEFLKENPEWEPFGVHASLTFDVIGQYSLRANDVQIYLRRRVP